MVRQAEIEEKARVFAAEWNGKGDEKQHSQKFWIGLLRNVCGCVAPEKVIDFEERVKIGGTKYIDGYIAETKTIIEQKGIKIDLDRAEMQSDGTELTPFEQAKRYNDNLPYEKKARWIVVSNFREFRIHDMNKEEPEKDFERVLLADFGKEYYRFQFLVDENNENIRREEDLSIEAGKRVDKLYEALLPEYIEPNESSLRSLNILCVRIVFCLYAEDAGLFATRTAFEDYLKSFNLPNVRKGLIDLFKALDTPLEKRDKYDTATKDFPYVNGGLFHDENIEIPNFTKEIVDVIVNDCVVFNWSEISPTIFGAVFESTLNPDTRRKGGMHYTSIQNIHKVIDPLFLDDLKAELAEITKITGLNERRESLRLFQEKISSLTFLDPACGSGNFLTESYLSLAKLEIAALEATKDTGEMFVSGQPKVDISQFYGIEINDFAVTVAKTALWIAESQVNVLVNAIVREKKPLFPLETAASIVEGNALRIDWNTLKPIDETDSTSLLSKEEMSLFSGFITEVDGSKIEYDYIMGNPPFVGARMMEYDGKKKKEIQDLFGNIKNVQDLDYVCGWYKKAAELIQGTTREVAFVSTNSITQGSQVPILWNVLLNDFKLKINFAYQTFKWENETTDKVHMAAVHCVIVGFSTFDRKEKSLYLSDGKVKNVKNISPYLTDAPNIYVEARKETLCDVPKMNMGNMARDGENFSLTEKEKDEILKKYPNLSKWIRPLIGAEEFIKGKKRFCFWLNGITPKEVKANKVLYERVEAVKNFRLSSDAKTTQGYAKNPYIWAQIVQPNTDFIVIPVVSSERRRYIPIGFLTPDNIPTTQVQIIPNATIYHFGVLTSSVHMAWMRAVCGRLEMRYRYSKEIVYNTFPWCNPTDKKKKKIEKTAQDILDARAKYPNSSLADLYDETLMPPDLRKAHRANDRAVMEAYGFSAKMSEAEIVAELFKMYENMLNAVLKGKHS